MGTAPTWAYQKTHGRVVFSGSKCPVCWTFPLKWKFESGKNPTPVGISNAQKPHGRGVFRWAIAVPLAIGIQTPRRESHSL